ncbi:hypothetical protein FB451DRAFT_1193567 [Mycena latifolia]|nr:hypothetical protein FB451DRAFT_1193567 [Mycena latifolia]
MPEDPEATPRPRGAGSGGSPRGRPARPFRPGRPPTRPARRGAARRAAPGVCDKRAQEPRRRCAADTPMQCASAVCGSSAGRYSARCQHGEARAERKRARTEADIAHDLLCFICRSAFSTRRQRARLRSDEERAGGAIVRGNVAQIGRERIVAEFVHCARDGALDAGEERGARSDQKRPCARSGRQQRAGGSQRGPAVGAREEAEASAAHEVHEGRGELEQEALLRDQCYAVLCIHDQPFSRGLPEICHSWLVMKPSKRRVRIWTKSEGQYWRMSMRSRAMALQHVYEICGLVMWVQSSQWKRRVSVWLRCNPARHSASSGGAFSVSCDQGWPFLVARSGVPFRTSGRGALRCRARDEGRRTKVSTALYAQGARIRYLRGES